MRTRFSCPSILNSRSSATIPPVDGGSSWAARGRTMAVRETKTSARKSERRRTDPAEEGKAGRYTGPGGEVSGWTEGGKTEGRNVEEGGDSSLACHRLS